MKVLKFLVWSSCAVGIGVFLGAGDIDGKTPLEHIRKAWERSGATGKLEGLKNSVFSALPNDTPKENHSPEDKQAVNKLIAKSAKQK